MTKRVLVVLIKEKNLFIAINKKFRRRKKVIKQ